MGKVTIGFQRKSFLLSLQHLAGGFELCAIRLDLSLEGCDYARIYGTHMRISRNARAILTDSHFLAALIVFCIGLALLITLH